MHFYPLVPFSASLVSMDRIFARRRGLRTILPVSISGEHDIAHILAVAGHLVLGVDPHIVILARQAIKILVS